VYHDPVHASVLVLPATRRGQALAG
jgi:hypothetical protein